MNEENKKKLKKIGMGFLMASAGAAVVAGLQFIQGVDFGSYTPLVVAVSGAMINAARVYFGVAHTPHNQ